MIEYINKRCNEWAAWLLVRRDGGMGYPHAASFMRLAVQRDRQAPSGPRIDDEAMLTERSIRGIDPGLRTVVEEFYLRMRSCPAESIARRLNCSRDTLYARLHRAHVAIMEVMNDLEAGVGDVYCGPPTEVPVVVTGRTLRKAAKAMGVE